jgi:hypothetical protein
MLSHYACLKRTTGEQVVKMRKVVNYIKIWPFVVRGLYICVSLDGRGKFHPRTGHEGPKGKYRYTSTFCLT